MEVELLKQMTWKDVRDICSFLRSLSVPESEFRKNFYVTDKDEIEYSYIRNELIRKFDKPKCNDRFEVVLNAAESAVGFKLTDVCSRSNTTVRTFVAYKLSKEGYKLSEIGRCMQRHHSTVIHMIGKMNDMFSLPKMYSKEIELYRKFEKKLSNQ